MAYTFTQKAAPTEPGQESNFGNLRNDGSHNAMAGVLGNGPQTVDVSGSPVASPATVATNATTTLTTPLNATQITLITATNTINVSEADSTVATKYFTIPVGVPVTIDVALTNVIYLKANTGSATVSFFYNVV